MRIIQHGWLGQPDLHRGILYKLLYSAPFPLLWLPIRRQPAGKRPYGIDENLGCMCCRLQTVKSWIANRSN